MTCTIAVAGKGGVGKTTIAALLIRALLKQGRIVLAIDADPSANLHQALGLALPGTVGDVREEMLTATKSGKFPAGMAKQDYLDVKIQESLVETSHGLDLLAMGRPEGPGCYCAANNMLRRCIDQLAAGYDFVVIDNEAGLEHISRQMTRDLDVLLIVSDPTVRGITAAGRVKALVAELGTRVGSIALVVNRVRNDSLSPPLRQALLDAGLDGDPALIPDDPTVGEHDAAGIPLFELPPASPVCLALQPIIAGLGLTAAATELPSHS